MSALWPAQTCLPAGFRGDRRDGKKTGLTRRALAGASLAMLASVGLGLTASVPAACAEVKEARRPVIGLVMKTLTNPFFAVMEDGARRASNDAGAELVVRTASRETAIEQQIGLVDSLIKMPVDAIVIAPADSARLVPVLVQAVRRGIVVVNVDNQLDFAYWQQFGQRLPSLVTVDNRKAADAVTERLLRGDNPAVAATALIVGGIPDADNSRQRVAGAGDAFARHANINVVGQLAGNWRVEDAYEASLAFLKTHPGIRYVFCANDMMAVGVLQAVQELGLSGVAIAGFDNLSEIRPSIAAGLITATVDQNAEEQGYLAVQVALDLLAGRPVSTATLVPVRVIDREALGSSPP